MNRIALAPIVLVVSMFAAAVAVAPRAESQQVPSSELEASWWVETRTPYVIGELTFVPDQLVAGKFAVNGVAMVRLPPAAANEAGCGRVELFDIAPFNNTSVVFGPGGQLRGELSLTRGEGNETCSGRLRIVRGKDRVAFPRTKDGELDTDNPVRRLTLRGRLTIGNRTLRRLVRLRGVKIANVKTESWWQGDTSNGRVAGRRIASNKFGVRVEASDGLGFPFLDLDASGAVILDGERQEDVVVTGTLAVARNRRGLVQIHAAGNAQTDIGSGWGRSRHFLDSRFDTTPHDPLVFVYSRLTPLNGTSSRRVVISGQLDALP
jgi:hypothetical protein